MQTRTSPSVAALHRLAKQASIPQYDTMPKTVLFKKLQESFDLDRLERAETRRNKMNELSSKKRSREIEEVVAVQPETKRKSTLKVVQRLNKYDPIMLNAIGKKNTWKFVRPNGSAIVFNIESLVDYILATGDFSDPVSRLAFTDEDLKEIDELATKAGLQKDSVLDLKKKPQAFVDVKFRRDAIQGLERCAGEVITDILNIIETCDPDEAQMRLLMTELPSFSDYYRQIRDVDAAFAKQCMLHWRQFLEGPPNHPNEDVYGMIAIVSHFLKMCEPMPSTGSSSSSSSSSSR